MGHPVSRGANAIDRLCLTSESLSPLDDAPDVQVPVENSRPKGSVGTLKKQLPGIEIQSIEAGD
jgi:hypothetical protein